MEQEFSATYIWTWDSRWSDKLKGSEYWVKHARDGPTADKTMEKQ